MLRHEGDGAIYIGMSCNLRKRCREWYSAVVGAGRWSASVSSTMRTAVCALDKEQWSFHVLVADPHLMRSDLSRLERRAIRRAMDKGERLLNSHTYGAWQCKPPKVS
ncbi:hypothetical protein CWO91_16675 [Bradyrhizobium genosp. SA-3]|nr:hypothetical protein CWO91_16675 [Bradyrhizobium genosp. SA-3]